MYLATYTVTRYRSSYYALVVEGAIIERSGYRSLVYAIATVVYISRSGYRFRVSTQGFWFMRTIERLLGDHVCIFYISLARTSWGECIRFYIRDLCVVCVLLGSGAQFSSSIEIRSSALEVRMVETNETKNWYSRVRSTWRSNGISYKTCMRYCQVALFT